MLQSDAEMADLIGRFDESPPDIVVPNDAELKRQSRFLGVTERRRDPRIGDGHDNVSVDMALAGEFHADAFARLVDAGPFDDTVGAGKINVLEDAEPAVAVAERHHAADPPRPND